jgi:hypothetical protein
VKKDDNIEFLIEDAVSGESIKRSVFTCVKGNGLVFAELPANDLMQMDLKHFQKLQEPGHLRKSNSKWEHLS